MFATQPVYNAGWAAHALRSDQNNAFNSGHYVYCAQTKIVFRPIGCLYNIITDQLTTNTKVVFVFNQILIKNFKKPSQPRARP